MHREPLLRLTTATLLTLSGAVLLPAQSAEAAGGTNITAAVLAGSNVTLDGPSIIDLPSGTTTYNGVFSGRGTLTIAGSGTLILTKDSDFTLPSGDQHQSVTTSGGNWPYPIVSSPDQPAVIVERGATLQYGTDGSSGIIGDYPYTSISGLTLNHDNIEVDGTLDLDIANREYNLGRISGSGTISQPGNTWGTLDLADDLSSFSGTIADGTGFNFGSASFRLSLPNAAAVDNSGSAIISARNYTLVLPENFYENRYGSDINFHTWQAGLIEMTGVDHYSDTSQDTASIAHTSNFRGINIEGANVQWGDGTTSRFFLPATPQDSYINIHKNGSLTFDYDGPVTLDTPISGGVYHASLSTPANASISLAPTSGNAVTFAVPMNYHGTTTIGHGATLLLGTGSSGGDSSLLTGASNDQIIDNGMLSVRDTSTAVTLANISGSGGLTQAGSATTTLSGAIRYTGPTTISSGTLAVAAGGSLSTGSLVQSAGSTLSLTPGTSAPIQVSGAVRLGGTLKVASAPTSGNVVLIHETGTQAVSGTFTGLPQGAEVLVGLRPYTISYTGGSGLDVVLTAGAPTTAASTKAAATPAETSAVENVADTGKASGPSGGSSVVKVAGAGLAAVAVAGGGVLFLKRRKRETAPATGRDRRRRRKK